VQNLIEIRLRNQRLTRPELRDPAAVVEWLGAVQSQDYAGAQWGVSQRMPSLTTAAFDRAFDEGRILRTHVLRPTWHFVPPADIRWMQTISAPRVLAVSRAYFRNMELDPATIGRTQRTFERALAGGKSLTRTELAAALGRAGIVASGQRLAAIVMHAELDQVLCSGPRRGKQFTYMLIAERAPQAVVMERDAAIVELARRYFRSHGPATLRDFVWWSGLTVGEARGGIEAIRASLDDEKVGDATYYMVPSRAKAPSATGLVHLLPNYDEYLIAYRDRAVAGMPVTADAPRNVDIYAHILIVDGRFAGTWRRAIKPSGVQISLTPFVQLNRVHLKSLAAAVARQGAFLGVPATLV
jgi:Winged helix DNA-binding domain